MLTLKMKTFVDYMRCRDWVPIKTAKEMWPFSDFIRAEKRLAEEGITIERGRAIIDGNYVTAVRITKTDGKKIPAKPVYLTPTQSEVVRIMKKKEGFVKGIDVIHITGNFKNMIKRFESLGFVFEERNYDNGKGSHEAIECRLISIPDNVRLMPVDASPAMPGKKRTDSKICTRTKTCRYGGTAGGLKCCDYILITGHSRGCLPGECTYYERRQKRKGWPRSINSKNGHI